MQRLELNDNEKALLINLIDAKKEELGLNIKELCFDIIDVSYYSKLISNKILADTNIYFELMQKLNFSYDFNFYWKIFDRYNEVYDNMILVEYDNAKKVVDEINQLLVHDNCLLTSSLRHLNKALIERLDENKSSQIDLKVYINCFNKVNINITYLIKKIILFNLNGVTMDEFVKQVDNYNLIDLDSNLLEIHYAAYLMNKKIDSLLQSKLFVDKMITKNYYSLALLGMNLIMLHYANNKPDSFKTVISMITEFKEQNEDKLSLLAVHKFYWQLTIIMYVTGEYEEYIINASKTLINNTNSRGIILNVMMNDSANILKKYECIKFYYDEFPLSTITFTDCVYNLQKLMHEYIMLGELQNEVDIEVLIDFILSDKTMLDPSAFGEGIIISEIERYVKKTKKYSIRRRYKKKLVKNDENVNN